MASNLTRAFIFRENGKTILYRILPDGDREIHMAFRGSPIEDSNALAYVDLAS